MAHRIQRGYKSLVCSKIDDTTIDDIKCPVLLDSSYTEIDRIWMNSDRELLLQLIYGIDCHKLPSHYKIESPVWLQLLSASWKTVSFSDVLDQNTFLEHFHVTKSKQEIVIRTEDDIVELITNFEKIGKKVTITLYDDMIYPDKGRFADYVYKNWKQFHVTRDATSMTLERLAFDKRKRSKRIISKIRISPPVYEISLRVTIIGWTNPELSKIYGMNGLIDRLRDKCKRTLVRFTTFGMRDFTGVRVLPDDLSIILSICALIDPTMRDVVTALPYVSGSYEVVDIQRGAWLDFLVWDGGFNISRLMLGRTYIVGKKNSGKTMVSKLIWRRGVPVIDSDDYGRVLFMCENEKITLVRAVEIYFSKTYDEREGIKSYFEEMMFMLVQGKKVCYSVPDVGDPILRAFGEIYDEIARKYTYNSYSQCVEMFVEKYGLSGPGDVRSTKHGKAIIFCVHAHPEATQVLGAHYIFQLSGIVYPYLGVILRQQHHSLMTELYLTAYYDNIHSNVFDVIPTGVITQLLSVEVSDC